MKKGLFALALLLSLTPALLLGACAEKEVGMSPEEVNATLNAKGSAQLPALDGLPAPHGTSEK
jgi:hypothetical protein